MISLLIYYHFYLQFKMLLMEGSSSYIYKILFFFGKLIFLQHILFSSTIAVHTFTPVFLLHY